MGRESATPNFPLCPPSPRPLSPPPSYGVYWFFTWQHSTTGPCYIIHVHPCRMTSWWTCKCFLVITWPSTVRSLYHLSFMERAALVGIFDSNNHHRSATLHFWSNVDRTAWVASLIHLRPLAAPRQASFTSIYIKSTDLQAGKITYYMCGVLLL